MNKEQTKKTLGQIACEAHGTFYKGAAWDRKSPIEQHAFEYSAQAVRDAVLAELPEWGLLPKGSVLQEWDQLSQHGMEFAEIVPTLVGEQMPRHCHGIRRLRPAATVPPIEEKPKSALESVIAQMEVMSEESKSRHENSKKIIERLRNLSWGDQINEVLKLTEERDAAFKRAEEAEKTTKMYFERARELAAETLALRASVPVWVPRQFSVRLASRDGQYGNYFAYGSFEKQLKTARLIQRFDLGDQNCILLFEELPPLPVETGSAEAQMRKEFEKWAVESLSLPIEKDHDGDYVRDETEDAWTVWKDAFLAGQQSTKP